MEKGLVLEAGNAEGGEGEENNQHQHVHSQWGLKSSFTVVLAAEMLVTMEGGELSYSL